jgi:putative N6-adenine-specific DNA methylase
MKATLFLPCARGAEALLARECQTILQRAHGVDAGRAGVFVRGDIQDAMRLNLWSRLAQRVLWPLAHDAYQDEHDLYDIARQVPWLDWITPQQTLKVDTTAHRAPLQSLNFATLRIKDAICDQVRDATGQRPSVDTQTPNLTVALHLSPTHATLYADTSGPSLFKRGWRDARAAGGAVHGEAPLKETLAATMLAASGWDAKLPLLDPCCGAGTIVIEAAQITCRIAPGSLRGFAFERMQPWQASMPAWHAMRQAAHDAVREPQAPIHASDVSDGVIAVARANAERAGVAHAITFSCVDALHRAPPDTMPATKSATKPASTHELAPDAAGVIVTNPPFGQRMDAQGAALGDNTAFAQGLATNWKRHYAGWTAWVLSPDADFEADLRLKASARVPMWNGPLECRLLKFSVVAGSMRKPTAAKP